MLLPLWSHCAAVSSLLLFFFLGFFGQFPFRSILWIFLLLEMVDLTVHVQSGVNLNSLLSSYLSSNVFFFNARPALRKTSQNQDLAPNSSCASKSQKSVLFNLLLGDVIILSFCLNLQAGHFWIHSSMKQLDSFYRGYLLNSLQKQLQLIRPSTPTTAASLLCLGGSLTWYW